jgi:hypothetical protein
MPISKADALFSLIQSMSKSEKRSFKLYVKKIQGGEQETQFFQLFKAIDTLNSYQEEAILEQLRPLSKPQLVNLRRHLYQHLCTSLRLVHIKKRTDTQVRELIDYAGILYGKGLYLQALQLLKKAKSMARGHHLDVMHLEILEFEKRIEFRHITRSLRGETGDLTTETDKRASIIAQTIQLSNLALELQGLYIKNGQAQNEEEAASIRQSIQPKLPSLKHTAAHRTFFEKVYLFQAYFWFAFLLNDLEECHYYINRSLMLFDRYPDMKKEDADLYMRLLHQDMSISFQKGATRRLGAQLVSLSRFFVEQKQSFPPNSRHMGSMYLHLARLNQSILMSNFEEAASLISPILSFIDAHQQIMDPHRIMVFYYKIAAVQIGTRRSQHAIFYLNKIINEDGKHLRKDIQIYARILFLMAHYDLENYDVMEFLIPPFERYFRKNGELNRLQTGCFDFLKKVCKLPADQKEAQFRVFQKKLEKLKEDPFLNRPFAYLNALHWVNENLH